MAMALVFEHSLKERQTAAASFFEAAVNENRLHHAYLLVGGEADDKLLVARRIAQFFNCSSIALDTTAAAAAGARESQKSLPPCYLRASEPESWCQNCRWIEEGKHPQAWFRLAPGEISTGSASSTSSVVSVEQARQISQELAKTSSFKRVVVVEESGQDVFHRPAANALLKTIEEPRDPAFFFFFAPSQDQVLATIVSRCQVVPFQRDGRKTLGPLAYINQGGKDVLEKMLGHDQPVLEAVKPLRSSPFFDWSRKLTQQKGHAHVMGETEHASSVSQALQLAKTINALIDDDLAAEPILDGTILIELEIIGSTAMSNPSFSQYSRQLLSRLEETKDQLSHYVSRKAAVEAFMLEWVSLRNKVSG